MPFRFSPSCQAIVLFERTESGFRSLDVVDGGFMPLRRLDADPAEKSQLPGIQLTDTAADPPVQLAIGGSAVTKLSRRGRSHLVATLLTGRGRRASTSVTSPKALGIYLQLCLRDHVTVYSTTRNRARPVFGIGLCEADGAGATIVEIKKPVSVVSFGECDETNKAVSAAIRRWSRAGCALAVEISHPPAQKRAPIPPTAATHPILSRHALINGDTVEIGLGR